MFVVYILETLKMRSPREFDEGRFGFPRYRHFWELLCIKIEYFVASSAQAEAPSSKPEALHHQTTTIPMMYQ